MGNNDKYRPLKDDFNILLNPLNILLFFIKKKAINLNVNNTDFK